MSMAVLIAFVRSRRNVLVLTRFVVAVGRELVAMGRELVAVGRELVAPGRELASAWEYAVSSNDDRVNLKIEFTSVFMRVHFRN